MFDFGRKKRDAAIISLAKVYNNDPDNIPGFYASEGSLGEIFLDNGKNKIGMDPDLAEVIKNTYGSDSIEVIFAHERGHDEYHR